MLGGKIKAQSKVVFDYTDEQLLFIRQMGIKYVYVIFKGEHTSYDSVMRFTERLGKFDLTAADASSVGLYKSDKIHLGLGDRDKAVEDYNSFNRILGKAGIPVVYMTWEPSQILTIAFKVSRHTRGGIGRVVDIGELEKRPYTHGRLYTREEMWGNLRYFLDRTLPACERTNVKITLHPNDPPVDCLVGISDLITSTEDCKHAFELVGNSPYLGMKMYIGCWLKGENKFGNVAEDIQCFVGNRKILLMHFRSVNSTVSCFEETLLEDGYMDTYELMKQFVRYDYDGATHADHVPAWGENVGGENPSWAYCAGYMKALLNCAKAELNK